MGYDQRQHTRFLPTDNAFAALGSEYTIVGNIKDISKGGIAFSYITDENQYLEPSQKIEIFLFGNNFNLSEMPCTIVYDTTARVFKTDRQFINKRCGVQFGVLTENQSGQLGYFIENYTVGSSS